MKQQLIIIALISLIGNSVFGQDIEKPVDLGAFQKAKANARAFVPVLPQSDKTEILNITGIGNLSFITSNFADGSSNSYNHSQKITMLLSVSSAKPVNVSLIFYSSGDKIPYAATSGDEGINVYYPINLYEEIKQRLEQSLSAKKKVQLKVTQKTDGFREAVLLF